MDLQQLCHQTFSVDVRSRYQMLLLSAHHDSVADDAAVTFFGEDPVLYWLDHSAQVGALGLEDHPSNERPSKH